MAGYVNRSLSLVDAQTLSKPNNGSYEKRKMAEETQEVATSPLKIFVKAKKKINDIFHEIEIYTGESAKFLEGVQDARIVTEDENIVVKNFLQKINGITEVIGRKQMKVAFFGRTSNGKSTVVNAMLKEKLLPSGIGHTTNCFLQVEGSDGGEAYLLIGDSEERQPVESVVHLAHALHTSEMGDQGLVKIRWPKESCALLKDDVILVDSPGIDVSPNLDKWIDEHCLDADVFILVANAESTLMQTEKNFFHKVSERLSKPNIFILNNRWDASASEPEMMGKVRQQHLDRNSCFLVDELRVVNKQQVEDRIFFISAKEVLLARLKQKQGSPPQSAALGEGFNQRMVEFQNFERKFEECLSKSAVKTKFEQHTERAKTISVDLKTILDEILLRALKCRQEREKLRHEQADQLDFVEKHLKLQTIEMKELINRMVEEVEIKVSTALNEEIKRLSLVIDEFDRPFHPDSLVLNVYKKELHSHVENGLGRNLQARCNTALMNCIERTENTMKERISHLLPQEMKAQASQIVARREFGIQYNLDCRNLCAEFQEDIEFRFSLGIMTLMRRFLGYSKTRSTLLGFADRIPGSVPVTPSTPSNEQPFPVAKEEDLVLSMFTNVAAIGSRSVVVGFILTGMFWRAVGWRIIAIGGTVYGLVYLYERLTWTNKAKERSFKQQYNDYASRKLRLIVDLTSSNCSHQVQQELSSTFSRLCHLVDQTKIDLQEEISGIDRDIDKLEQVATKAKVLRNKANWIDNELDLFISQYLVHEE